jgi:NAD(P)-dependent dehydrogenase (short-subunit alcohol dehydrogenase family)
MLARSKEQLGPLTTLINNAGYADFMPFLDYDIDQWKKLFDVDLNGVFHCTQASVPQMEESGAGFIVNIASIHASQTLANMSAYAAAKAGVVSLTKNLAYELGPRNIRVNALSPGTIETDLLIEFFDSLPPDERDSTRDYMLSWCPLGRFGQPSDIANIALFLCSDGAAFIHGSEIIADGGHLARLF